MKVWSPSRDIAKDSKVRYLHSLASLNHVGVQTMHCKRIHVKSRLYPSWIYLRLRLLTKFLIGLDIFILEMVLAILMKQTSRKGISVLTVSLSDRRSEAQP